MLFVSSIWNVVKHITVEPMLALYFISTGMSGVAGLNLLLQKACHPGTLRPLFTDQCGNEGEAQKIVTNINTWKPILQYTLPILFVTFAGPWSDNHGNRRRPLMFLPVCGQLIADLCCLFNVFYWEWSTTTAAVSESLLPGLTGTRICLLIGACSYISDITSAESRTFRLGIIAAIFFISTPIGTALGGFLRPIIEFDGIYITCALLNISSLLCGMLLVKNTACDKEGLKKDVWEGMFDPRAIVQSFKTVTKKRDGFKRTIIILMILLSPLNISAMQGEYSVLLFFLRYKFHWDEVDFGLYVSYKLTVILIGTIMTIGVFSKLFHFKDSVIGIMACCTQILAALGNAFADKPWELYVYPLIDIMHGGTLAIIKSIASKSVSSNEQGQTNSVMGIMESIFPLITLPLYNKFYNLTFETMPGAFFLLSVAISSVAVLMFCITHLLQHVCKQSTNTATN